MVHPILQLVAYGELTVCWIVWLALFVQRYRKSAGQEEIAKAPAAQWGILLDVVGFLCIWVHVRPAGFEKSMWELIASMLLGPPSVLLAWRATRHLGKYWRFQAALNANHEAEDQLLETYFQDEFIEYRARVRGYIPFIR
ncbi:MAG: hypothetical protein ABSE96_10715 [Terracidiphilus sp.]|jgi:protein-S-isoprenylcysteine O-methyltransferase Ste14